MTFLEWLVSFILFLLSFFSGASPQGAAPEEVTPPPFVLKEGLCEGKFAGAGLHEDGFGNVLNTLRQRGPNGPEVDRPYTQAESLGVVGVSRDGQYFVVYFAEDLRTYYWVPQTSVWFATPCNEHIVELDPDPQYE